MAEAVYVLCTLTSFACAALLFRAWSRNRVGLLFWSGLCFAALSVNNGLLFLDMVILPAVDLRIWRELPALAGVIVLLYGLVWHTE